MEKIKIDLSDVLASLDKACEQYDTEREAEQKQLEDDDANIEAAEKMIEQASSSGDLEAYQAAKKAKVDAVDRKELDQRKFDKFCATDPIDQTEYDLIISAIDERINSYCDIVEDRIAEMVKDAPAIYDELQENVQAAEVGYKEAFNLRYTDQRERLRRSRKSTPRNVYTLYHWLKYSKSPTWRRDFDWQKWKAGKSAE